MTAMELSGRLSRSRYEYWIIPESITAGKRSHSIGLFKMQMEDGCENEYEDDFMSYHSDFDPSSSQDNSQEASEDVRQPSVSTSNAYTVPANITMSKGTVVFSQPPMDYRKKCLEGICKEQFVRTLQQFVSRGTSTYRGVETVTRGVQVPSLLANSSFDQGGITLAESLMTIALTGQVKCTDMETLSVHVRNKSILKNLNTMKEKLLYRGTRETKIGFLMERCVEFSEGYIALIAVKLLETELDESPSASQEGVFYPLNRTNMYQFLLVSCDVSLTITHVYTGKSGTCQWMPVDFVFIHAEQGMAPRIVLFSQLIKHDKNTVQSKRPHASDSISILTAPLLEGFCEIPYRPSNDFSPPLDRILYRVAYRLARNIVIIGLTEQGLLYFWTYNELNNELSARSVASFPNGITALSIHTISFSSRTTDTNIIIHLTNGLFLVLQFMSYHTFSSELQRVFDAYSTVSTVIPGTPLSQNVYYNPMHTAIRSIKRIPHITIKLASTIYNGITCIQYVDGAVECFGSAISERLAVCMLHNDGLSVLMGPICENIAEKIYRELQD